LEIMVLDVVDNQGQRLAERMRDLLAGATGARLAVGYLFLDGLAPLRGRIEQLDSLEILIGNVVNRLTEEQVREAAEARVRGGEAWVREQEDVAATLRATRDRAAAETALNLRRTLADLPRTPEMRALVLALAGRIADGGLKVRLYTEGRIHAKLALLEYPIRRREGRPVPEAAQLAVVGSSNLTLGAPAHPTELNVIVRDPESVCALSRWYQGLWDTAQDFHRELFDELGQSWALGEGRPG
jgi:phosphatidylserine/phosphatidylglycerophosphate/cardiolipin synthase-like enzyme